MVIDGAHGVRLAREFAGPGASAFVEPDVSGSSPASCAHHAMNTPSTTHINPMTETSTPPC